jgi:DNA-binding Xre family transcriptional regulator
MPMKNRVKQFVDSRDLTVYRFIKDTGIAPGTGYKLYKNSKHMPSPTVLEAICDTYEVQPNEILEWCKNDEKIVGSPAQATNLFSETDSGGSSPKSQNLPKQQTKTFLQSVA